ncbi:nucleotidyltransferase family protein [candidate division WOR-3 bacterium]|nr:nucleotidyltransferase family protein [candidate division WOR-3 bacterium]
MNRRSRIPVPEDKIREFCKKHHIRSLALFGSVLRDDFQPTSDIDILVEFVKDHTPGYFRLFRMQEELSSILGRKVDLRTPQELSRYFREEVLAEQEVYYKT